MNTSKTQEAGKLSLCTLPGIHKHYEEIKIKNIIKIYDIHIFYLLSVNILEL